METIKYDTFIDKTIEDILSYAQFLKEQNYPICFYRLDSVFLPYAEKFRYFFGHPFEKCIRVKEKRHKDCKLWQDRLMQSASKDRPTLFTCFAGVSEFVLPIEYENVRYGLIALSGYRKEGAKVDKESISLNPNLPDLQTVQALLLPFTYMFQRLIPALLDLQDESKLSGGEKAYKKALAFIAENADRQFSFSELCQEIGYSRAYIGKEFKTRTGTSVFEYVTNFRITRAKRLLIDTQLSVSDVAFHVGYTDSNYFTNVFKSRVGISPRTYRKNQKTTE